MLATDAVKILAKLKTRASLDHLALRMLYWASFVYCTWILLSTASFLVDYGQLNFHLILLSSLSLLPPFLFLPSASRSFIKSLRPYDIQTTVETYISMDRTKLTRLQEKQTEEAIRIVSMKKFKKKMPNILWLAVVTACTILFIAFQLVSLKTGRGFFGAYAQRLEQQKAAGLDGESESSGYDYRIIDQAVPDAPAPQQSQSDAGTRDLRKEKSERDEASFPSLVLGEKENSPMLQNPGALAEGVEAQLPEKTDPGTGGGRDTGKTPAGNKPDKPESDARSRNPGHEGSGTALQNNPLIAYTAYFERLFLEHSGKKTALSQVQTEAEFTSLIAGYYSSFTTIVDIKPQNDPTITAARQSWLAAFTAKARN